MAPGECDIVVVFQNQVGDIHFLHQRPGGIFLDPFCIKKNVGDGDYREDDPQNQAERKTDENAGTFFQNPHLLENTVADADRVEIGGARHKACHGADNHNGNRNNGIITQCQNNRHDQRAERNQNLDPSQEATHCGKYQNHNHQKQGRRGLPELLHHDMDAGVDGSGTTINL